MVFIPQAQPHAQSLSLFPIVFGHSDSLTSYETLSKKTAVAYGADLLPFELNREVVSGLPGHHSLENLVLSWARRVVGDDCLE